MRPRGGREDRAQRGSHEGGAEGRIGGEGTIGPGRLQVAENLGFGDVRAQPDDAQRRREHDGEGPSPGQPGLIEPDGEERAEVEHRGDQAAPRAAPCPRPRFGHHGEPEGPLPARADTGEKPQREEAADAIDERHAARRQRIQDDRDAERPHPPDAVTELREEHPARGTAEQTDADGRPDLLQVDVECRGDLGLKEDEQHDVRRAEQKTEAGGEERGGGRPRRVPGRRVHDAVTPSSRTPGFITPAGSRARLTAVSACPKSIGRSRSYHGRWVRPTA
jgi:hypothetical protein